MSRHTPGPWFVMENGFSRKSPVPTVYAPGDELRYIAFCSDLPSFGEPTDNLANARLIAAAPDLLHCLKVILDHAEGREDWEVALHLDKAREAVAKAEGKA